MNARYTDLDFDLDYIEVCLNALTASSQDSQAAVDDRGQKVPTPACAKRVGEIFTSPHFFTEHDPHVKCIRQGAKGHSCLITSLNCLEVDEAHPRLLEKICPKNARNEEVGVYGFVFYRDGEWISEVIDDKLYLKNPNYDDCDDERRLVWNQSHSNLDPEASREEYKKQMQMGSDALFFGSCSNQNETWVPLLEKAFAKAHGDYEAIAGGWPGEVTEDITGGVTTILSTSSVLNKDTLWAEDFTKVGLEYIIIASTRTHSSRDLRDLGRQGIHNSHTYSLLRAVEYLGTRLCLMRNPKGETVWNGPWSDGSKEWTSEAMQALGYESGDENVFWIPFENFLERFGMIWKTRIFSPEWMVAQLWTGVDVPWEGGNNSTHFTITLPVTSTTVIVISQLDTRYFGPLSGQYIFNLAFILHTSSSPLTSTTSQTRPSYQKIYSTPSGSRSTSTTVSLPAGIHTLTLQITSSRNQSLPKIETIVRENWLRRREKLVATALRHYFACARAGCYSAEEDKKETSIPQRFIASSMKPSMRISTAAESASATRIKSAMETAQGKGTTIDEPWDAQCVVGLRVYTHQTPVEIKCYRDGEEEDSVKYTSNAPSADVKEDDGAGNGNSGGKEKESEIRKLFGSFFRGHEEVRK
ncbi:hypothetical protein ACMFMG_006356 [Clarireedia jacksonii]